MELSEDFIRIQGILVSIESSAGCLSKKKYRGGNETTINDLTIELHKFLTSKNYIKDKQVNKAFEEQLQNICMFLILNTELKHPIEDPEFQHLINIAPQLSTCLLANVIIGLDLSKQYCGAILRYNINITEDFFAEMIPCLKKCKLKVHSSNAYEFLKLIVTKLSVLTDSETIEKITDIAAQMLLNLTGLHGDELEKVTAVYQCMGYTLLNLLSLLLMCNDKKSALDRITEKLVKTCCSIMMAVTLDVFCSWAEVEEEGEVLQILIAEKSYMCVEKYQKYAIAKELVSMLGSIAKKPKTITEQIYLADVPTMITMIDKADVNQKHWFTALLNTQVLKCAESVKCVEKWAHLCTVSDVTRLLSLSVQTTDPAAKKVVTKCAATLDFEDLVLVTTRHFHQNGISHSLSDNVQPQLIVLFNKIKDKKLAAEFCRELYLLVLQNANQSLSYIFGECCKNSFYSINLSDFWPSIKEIIMIDNVGVTILKNEIQNCPPTEHNCSHYTQLFNVLIEKSVFTCEKVALQIILPSLQESCSNNNYQVTKYGLDILKELQGNIFLKSETEGLFNFIFETMKICRCNFLNFDGLKQEMVKLLVDIVQKYCDMNANLSCEGKIIKSEDLFVSFYQQRLLEESSQSSILTHFFPINFGNHAETVAHLIKILPLCVTPEWILISTNLVHTCGIEKTIELFCDFAILLCELVKSQKTKTEEVNKMFHALGYCLQNLGIVIKECFQPQIKDPKEDIALTKNVCRLLKDIPAGNLKSEEGLSLASLLSDTSLRSLRSDKKFAVVVASIQESTICKMLAQKILS